MADTAQLLGVCSRRPDHRPDRESCNGPSASVEWNGGDTYRTFLVRAGVVGYCAADNSSEERPGESLVPSCRKFTLVRHKFVQHARGQ